MKLVSYREKGTIAFGAVCGDSVANLSRHFDFPDLRSALMELPALEAAIDCEPARTPIAALDLLPPIPDPPRIFCIGRNYKRSMRSLGLAFPDHPILFARFPHSQVGHRQPLVRPSVSTQLDYEGELAVIIGRPGRHIPPSEALGYVAGYTCYNDGSVRDYQRHTSQDTPGKNFWRSGSAGPWLVTADELPDPAALILTTRLNGEIVQRETLDDLLFDVASIIAYLSAILPLAPGDTIATGTPLGAGVTLKPPRWLAPGDEVSVEISGIGTLTNGVIDEANVSATEA